VHLLFVPAADGPRAVFLADGALVTKAVAACSKYDLLVVDEAHHVYRDEQFRATLESLPATRWMLLSDVSQGLTNDACFPDELTEVVLTEVVRSSKRIVAGAMKFQLQGEDKLLTKCHHESEGPPLQSFLFDIKDDENRYEDYAAQTVRAVQHVVAEFPGLDLHDRLAIIVPDSDFRDQLGPPLGRQLASSLPERDFEFVDAASACSACSLREAEPTRPEWLVLDTIEQMDGLERLIVVCVGLDAAQGAADSTLQSRSMLYRAITRAHMMVLVVNEYVAGGWFAFLTKVKLGEDKKFDTKQTLAAAKEDGEATDLAVAAAAMRRQVLEQQAARILEQLSLDVETTEDQLVFLQPRLMAALSRSSPAAEALGDALEAWKQNQLAAVREQELEERVAGVLKQYSRDAETTEEKLLFLQPMLATALGRGIQGPEALADALKSWERDQQLRQMPTFVSRAAHNVGIVESASVVSLQNMAIAKMQRGGALEASVQAVVDEWQQVSNELGKTAEQQRLRISDTTAEYLVGVVIGKRKPVLDALVVHALSENAKQHQLSLDVSAKQLLEKTVHKALERGSLIPVAVKAALDEWMRIDVALIAEVGRRRIDTGGPDGRIDVSDVVLACQIRSALPDQTVEQVVSKVVDKWQIRVDAMAAIRRQRNLVVQSIWDASTNVTTAGLTSAGPGYWEDADLTEELTRVTDRNTERQDFDQDDGPGGWADGTWVFQPRGRRADGVGRLRGAIGGNGKVEVRWANWSTSTVKAATLVENAAGYDGLSQAQTKLVDKGGSRHTQHNCLGHTASQPSRQPATTANIGCRHCSTATLLTPVLSVIPRHR
jgi:hypothetical protein